MPTETPNVTPGAFPEQQPVDRSASGLNYQAYQLNSTALGALGRGRRVTPEADSLFRQPNLPALSGGQFGGGHAKSFASPEGI